MLNLPVTGSAPVPAGQLALETRQMSSAAPELQALSLAPLASVIFAPMISLLAAGSCASWSVTRLNTLRFTFVCERLNRPPCDAVRR